MITAELVAVLWHTIQGITDTNGPMWKTMSGIVHGCGITGLTQTLPRSSANPIATRLETSSDVQCNRKYCTGLRTILKYHPHGGLFDFRKKHLSSSLRTLAFSGFVTHCEVNVVLQQLHYDNFCLIV